MKADNKKSNNKVTDINFEIYKELRNKEKDIIALQKEIECLRQFREMYEVVINSRTWKMTKPLRVTMDTIKTFSKINLIKKGLYNLKEKGVKDTIVRTKNKVLGLPNVNNIESNNRSDGFTYFSTYMDNYIYNGTNDVKILCFYLPQFHCFPENDKWWGKGYTEWTNTRKAKPLYDGHYQPREPHDDIGYYDLTSVEALKKQAQLAKEHGIFGFCIYYYWFSGKKLMEKPIDLLLEHKEIDINFCLCWANENWTRTWDGANNDILIKQDYSSKDPKKFIQDIKKYIQDKRYIKFNGKPVIVVYNPSAIKNVKDVFFKWKQEARNLEIGEISIWICKSFNNDIDGLGLENLVDRQIEFPPHNLGSMDLFENKGEIEGSVYNYSLLVDKIIKERDKKISNNNTYRTAMLGWDNSPRRKKGYNSFDNFDLRKYYNWLRLNIEHTNEVFTSGERFTFINAWNEWAEGTYLEPDQRFGYASLNITSKALYGIPFELFRERIRCNHINSRIAVQVHIFYEELSEEIINSINNIPEDYDCYITTDNYIKANIIFNKFNNLCNANKIVIYVVPNIGRDVAPLLVQMKSIALKYQYLCHIHTKKSKHSNFGDLWRRYLFDNMLGSVKRISEILDYFDKNKDTGIIYPDYYKNIKNFIEWGSNKLYAYDLLYKINMYIILEDKIDFPAGNMFWLRTEAAKEMFTYDWQWEDFPSEMGQLDGTIMHAIERCWILIIKANGYNDKMIDEKFCITRE